MPRELSIDTGDQTVSALIDTPADPSVGFVFAHGAGAGMRHAFMEALTMRLVERRVAVLRYMFPYMDKGSRRPDRAPVLEATVRAAIKHAAEELPELPLLAGGKSMGGRMTSHVFAEDDSPPVRGLVFVGYPLHPAGKPATKRAEHLPRVSVPMLFLQGTRDKLAEMPLVDEVIRPLPRAHVHVVDGADHGFHVLKRSGRTDDEVLDELADQIALWRPD